MDPLKKHFVLKMRIFHPAIYASLPEGNMDVFEYNPFHFGGL